MIPSHLGKLILVILLFVVASCQDSAEENNSQIDELLEFNYNGKGYITEENQNNFVIGGSCIQLGLELVYHLEEEGTIGGFNREGSVVCIDGSWEVGPLDFSELEESAKVRLTISIKGISDSIVLTKDTIPPDLSGLPEEISTPVKSYSWNLGCSELSCFHRYVINQNRDDNDLSSERYQALDFNPSIDSGNGRYYLHIQASDFAGNETPVKTVSVNLDNTSPQILGNITLPSDKTYREGEVLSFQFTFNEEVILHGEEKPYLSLDFTGQGASATVTSGTAFWKEDHDADGTTHLFTYSVESGIYDDDGIQLPSQITIPEDSSLSDIAGNPVIATISSSTHLSGVLINSMEDPPQLTSVNALGDGVFRGGETVMLSANFNREVSISNIGGIILSLDRGGQVIAPLYGAGESSISHNFTYEVLEGHEDSAVEVTGIQLGDGSIVDGNTFPVSGNNIQLTVGNMTIDNTAPENNKY